jgi:tRNA(fMet)-specific endonuclease VapC
VDVEVCRRADALAEPSRSYHAMVAAIAIANDFPLYTADPSDFTGIDGLDVRAVTVPPVVAER